MSTALVRNLPDLAFLSELEVSLLIVFKWRRDVKLSAATPFGVENQPKGFIFGKSKN